MKAATLFVLVAAIVMWAAGPALAQTSPTPGPTNPNPESNPLSKPGTDLVINPTTEECEKGWRTDLKWTREQFDAFCVQMKTSK